MVELFLRFRDAFEFHNLVVVNVAYKNVLFIVDDNVERSSPVLLWMIKMVLSLMMSLEMDPGSGHS